MTENQNPRVQFCQKTWKIPTKTKDCFSRGPFLSMKHSVKSKIENSPGRKVKPICHHIHKVLWEEAACSPAAPMEGLPRSPPHSRRWCKPC